jgi:two-component system sensor histidine kinase CpxA
MADRLNAYVTSQKRFLGDIAHELCSPISRLQMALALLESTATSEQEATLRDIREEVQEMSALINELLAFSKASLRAKDTPLVGVDVNAVLARTVAKVGGEASIKFDATGEIFALADELLLERAISNILRNAVRYAGQAGPIEVKAVVTGDEVKITTSDSGPGVPPEAIKLLGEPFYRPESSRNRSAGGVGLGLAIVKTCVESCDGIFEVGNRLPHGLEVSIRLKAFEPNDTPELVVRETGMTN